jgi:ankyrin repeat protein
MLSNRFRWVYYKLDVLRQCHRNDLRRIIKALPQSLDETYQRTLKEINYANSKQAHRLLQCLVAAHRPLRVEELAEVLVLDVDAGGIPRFNAVWHWEDHEAAVLSTCSSLVSVVDHDGSRVVQFCHFSAKEFLMSDRLSSISSTEDISQFHISHDSSHVILAQACVGVLLRVDDPTSDDGAGLSGYAYEHWLGHVQVLLERNVDVRMHGNSGDTPLHLAASSHYLEVARMLLERNAEVNSLDDKGLTPLRRALEGVPRGPDIVRFVRLLFDNGADLHTRDKRGNTLLHFAASRGHLEVARTLLELKADVNSVNKEGLTPLHKISRMWLTRSPDIVRLLFDNGANLHVRDNSGNTPLHLAASGGHLEAARTLLELKADVNSLDGKGSTPLHRALEGVPRGPDIVRLVRLLFDNGADLHARDNSGDTPLHSAASRGHLEVTRMLLEHNAEVNPKNSHGSTPLHLASAGTGNEGGNLDVVRLLFGHGADVKAQNLNGEIASQLAHGSYQQEIVQLLSQQAVE